MQFKIKMNRTITDPVERRHRLAQLFAFFERPNQTADDVDTRQDGTSPAENTEANELTRQIDSTAKPGTAQEGCDLIATVEAKQ